jgi:hypothetical protein
MTSAVKIINGAKKINAITAIETSSIRIASMPGCGLEARDFNAIAVSLTPTSSAAARRASRTSLDPNWYKFAPPGEQLHYVQQHGRQAKFHFALHHE